jgi:predicted transport protein
MITSEIYSELKSAILNLGKDIEVRPKKQYVAFRRKQAFVSFVSPGQSFI